MSIPDSGDFSISGIEGTVSFTNASLPPTASFEVNGGFVGDDSTNDAVVAAIDAISGTMITAGWSLNSGPFFTYTATDTEEG
jgi:hypothetical protein